MTDNSGYRKRFPKGKDWEDPKPNPYKDGGSGLHPDSYHGMETIGVTIEKYNELKDKLNHIIELVYQYPNDMELGGKVRHYTYENLNKDNA